MVKLSWNVKLGGDMPEFCVAFIGGKIHESFLP